MRVAIYARLSSNRKGESTSIARQVDACRKRFEPDWQEVTIYQDDDFSAYGSKSRPAWERMLADIGEGRIDLIVAYALDRLGRRPADIERLLQSGVRFVTVRDNLDSAGAASELYIRILAAVAKMESDNLGARVTLKHDELRRSGKWSGGRRVFGLSDDWTAIVDDEADLIRDAAKRIVSGEPLGRIARELRDAGILTASGHAWSASGLRKMMLSPRLIGRRRSGNGLSEGIGIPAILDEETWRKVQVVLTDPSRLKHDGNGIRYLLAGMLQCSECHSPMHTHQQTVRGRKMRRYHCLSARGGCGKVTIMAEPAEQEVANRWLKHMDSDAFRKFAAERRAEHEERMRHADSLRDELAALLDRRNALIDLWAAGELSQDEWLRARAALDGRIHDVESALASARPEDLSWWDSLGLGAIAWSLAPDVASRRVLLQSTIDRVIVHPAKRRGRFFDPDRLEPVFREPDLHPAEFLRADWLPGSMA